jgi:hypothetical protein
LIGKRTPIYRETFTELELKKLADNDYIIDEEVEDI